MPGLFPAVFDRLSRGLRKDEKITLLLDHCRRTTGGFDLLLTTLADHLQHEEEIPAQITSLPGNPVSSVVTDPVSDRQTPVEREAVQSGQTNFIAQLGIDLVAHKEVHDLSQNSEFAKFDFIGFKDAKTTLDLIALVRADDLTERAMVDLRNTFFDVTQTMPQEFGLKPGARKPNGLLAFVFEHGCSPQLTKFISKQTKISQGATTGAVIVSWAIDLQSRQVHTHTNPVSILPPVVILPGLVFPGLDYLMDFLKNYQPVSSPAGQSANMRASLIDSLNVGLTEAALDQLCFDQFPTVYRRFRPNMSKLEKIRSLVMYCEAQEQLDRLSGLLGS